MVHLFRIGNIHIYLFGVMIAIGMAVGYFIVRSEIKRKELDLEVFSDLAVYALLSALIGARLFFVLAFDPLHYLQNPLDIVMIQNGGLSIQGGLLGGMLFAYFYLKRKKIEFKNYADAFVPGIIIGQFIGRIGCDVFGIPMKQTYFWGVMNNGQLVHPVQIYEALLDLLLFGILWSRRDRTIFKGQLFCEYIIGFGIIRGFVEFFRVNPIWLGQFTVAHFLSLAMVLAGISIYIIFKKNITEKAPQVTSIKKMGILKFWCIVILMGVVGTALFYSIR